MREGSEPTPPVRVVVTGMGAVSAFGWGIEPLRAGLFAGRTAIGPFDRFDPARHRTRVAAQVPPEPEDPRGTALGRRRTSLADRFARFAASEAAAQAGLDPASLPGGVGVYFGSSNGGMLETEEFYARLLERPGRRARVSALASEQYNGPGDAAARSLGASGPVVTISSACASAAMAIGRALLAVRRGEVGAALAGGADTLCRLTYAGFNSLRSVDEGPCRPFRRGRAGLSLGEGAAVFVLERLESALVRGSRPLAELRAAAASCDAFHMTTPPPGGEGEAAAVRAALDDAGLAPEDVDFINAHGTGTPLNDPAEWAGLRAVFGDRARQLPVTSSKALVGHLLGSSGAIEAVATVLCLEGGSVHPMPEGGALDPELPMNLVLGEPRRLPRARHAVSVSLGFGGANAALVLSRSGEDPRRA